MRRQYILVLLSIVYILVGCSEKDSGFEINSDNNSQNEAEVIVETFTCEDRGKVLEYDFRIYLEPEDIINSANLIISGKIINIDRKTEIEDIHGPMEYWEEYTLEVYEIYKGECDEDNLRFGIASYNMKFMNSKFSKELSLLEGEEYLLLLRKDQFANISTSVQSIYPLDGQPVEVNGISITKDDILDDF